MTSSIRAFALAAALLSTFGAERSSLALTTRAPLSEPVKTDAPTPAREALDAAGAEARAARTRVCHISRHPRDGIPASVHACPLVVADADAPATSSAAD